MRACLHSFPKTFLNALTADFLNANYVMSGKEKNEIAALHSHSFVMLAKTD